jgi:hypothetical protein
MALYPEQAERVYQEVKDVDPSDINTLANLPCLNGFINESMRLIPAALTMGTRTTPAEGMTVDGTYIPGGIKVAAPKYTIFRSTFSRNYPLSLSQQALTHLLLSQWKAHSKIPCPSSQNAGIADPK